MADWNYAEWAEKAAMENLRGKQATADVLLAQANQLLTLLLVGMGGALTYGVQVLDGLRKPLTWGAAAVSVWLALTAAALVWKCISTRPTPAVFNEPKNIYKPELDLTEQVIRQHELKNVQHRIEEFRKRNDLVAAWLDGCRFAAAATPLVFALTATLMR